MAHIKHTPQQNVRYANRTLRLKYRARLKAMGCECGICHGKYGPIHYDEPSDYKHPLSFVVDEIIPISKATLYGYGSAREAAEDFNNLQAAHYWCNSIKSNKIGQSIEELEKNTKHHQKKINLTDGDW